MLYSGKIAQVNVYKISKGAKMASTLETISSVLQENLDIAAEDVVEDATFESLGIDSLDMAELTCTLEEELDIDLGEPEGLATIGDLVDYIDEL